MDLSGMDFSDESLRACGEAEISTIEPPVVSWEMPGRAHYRRPAKERLCSVNPAC